MSRWQSGPGRLVQRIQTSIQTSIQSVIQARQWHWLILLSWMVPLLLSGFFDLDHQSLMAHDEGLYARRARVMVDTGDWVHPWDVPQHKTPGPYWVVALFIQFLGRHEIAVRLPSVLASIGCILLTYAIGRRLLTPTGALLGALSLGVAPLWLQYSRLATPDVLFTGLILLAVWLLLLATEKQKSPWLYLAAGITLGITILVRSALAIVPLACLLPYLLGRQHLKQWSLYLGVLVGLLPTGIWLWLCWQRYDMAVINALINFPVSQSLTADRAKSPLFYLVNLLGNDFLWVFFALAGVILLLITLVRAKHKLAQLIEPQMSLLLIYPITYLGVLSFASTKLPHYAIPTYPFLAMLTGYAMARLEQTVPRRLLKHFLNAVNGLLACVGSLLAVTAILALATNSLPSTDDIRPYAPIALGLGLMWLAASLLWFQPGSKPITSWLGLLLLGHWISLTIAWGTADLGNINPEMKALLIRDDIKPILQTESIDFSPGLNSKRSTLLRFYTPNLGEKLQNLDQVGPDDHLWIENSELSTLSKTYDDLGQIKQTHLVRIRSD